MPGDRKHHSDKWHSCVEKVMKEGHDESSASAICTASLQKAGEPIFEGAEARSAEEMKLLEAAGLAPMRHLHLLGATGTVRSEMVNGREYLVVPVVALMEGVIHAVNADTPEFVSATVLEKAAPSWVDKPTCVGHPQKGGKQCSANSPEILHSHGFGKIRSAVMKGAKLFMETLVDPLRLKELKHERLLADLREGRPVEVSVGAYVRTNDKRSEWNGKPYVGEWMDVGGDHLAFLPGGRGACSLDMGCGAHRAAMMHLVTAESIETLANKTVECPTCKGTGQVKSEDGKQEDCPTCEGEGQMMRASQMKALIGSRHSSKDMEVIQSMHDHAVALGAQCDRGNYKTMEEKSPCSCGAKKEEEPRAATVRNEGGKWVLYTKDGSKRLSTHNTRDEAVSQERLIEAKIKKAS